MGQQVLLAYKEIQVYKVQRVLRGSKVQGDFQEKKALMVKLVKKEGKVIQVPRAKKD
jgi:hypothetical protein